MLHFPCKIKTKRTSSINT